MNNKFFFALTFHIFLVSFLTGCTSYTVSVPDVPKPNLSTTGMGTASGAAIGAGLGTLVGSTTGNAGEGFLVGGLAGAAIGAGIGRKFQDQEEVLAKQEEDLNAQKEVISSQERQIEELRMKQNDQFMKNNRPSRLKKNFHPEDYSGNPRAKLWNPDSGSSNSNFKEYSYNSNSIKPPKPEFPVLSSKPKSRIAPKVAEVRTDIPKIKERISEPSSVKPKAEIQEFSSSESLDVPEIVVKKPTVSLPNVKPKMNPAVSSDISDIPDISAVAAKKLDNNIRSEKCKLADEELARANRSTSDADKLFYLRRSLRLCPEESEFHYQIGKIYSNLGRIDDAKFEFRQAIDLDPNNNKAKNQLSMLE